MRMHFPKNYWQSVAVMVGYIIGVGMFSLPYVIAKAGIITFVVFILFNSIFLLKSHSHPQPGQIRLSRF